MMRNKADINNDLFLNGYKIMLIIQDLFVKGRKKIDGCIDYILKLYRIYYVS